MKISQYDVLVIPAEKPFAYHAARTGQEIQIVRDVFFGPVPDGTTWWDGLSSGIWVRGFQRVLKVGVHPLLA